mmetsp:Transcript_23537/g.36700  ORF Transcript_23537/g.36700 Transcript_23537/m.36700 type:complete len:175 (-) Transcript_23537:129-653(-)|eukprot:CAMPEP_0201521368 /NCGR_PEP_ID=MMETSP0161_2-20130828/14382_1 /ASSEMBLY_ACC=CAM_ASM_000251 /TAXON_ID=180227 /ORGANISM="Neoparamoeba aestuarina, Strain SoJaBio B1-5/56/2" /LENGTH=174 /DNA_ID=CAMNT_0047919997 /DNA_START=26 /DNA_END=550 /DNA_ORIENTATION=-
MNHLYSVHCVIILDTEGKRILSKYYNESKFPTLKEQTAFEKLLWSKTRQRGGEVALIDNLVVLIRETYDARIYFIGSAHDNELMLYSALSAFFDSIFTLLGEVVDRRGILENFDYVILALDEIIDGGIILEIEPDEIVARVSMRGADADSPVSEQSLSQALTSARQQIARTLLS